MCLRAGAVAAQYHVKEAARRAGYTAATVALHGGTDSGWYYLNTGGVSVHCFDRDTRVETNLEELWGSRGNLTWWRTSERPLTLDNITLEGAV